MTSGFWRACFRCLLGWLLASFSLGAGPNQHLVNFSPSIATMYKQIATFFALIASAMAFVPEPVAKGKLSGEDPPSIDRGWAENGIGARDLT